MKRSRNLILYLLLNIVVSALTTFTVLWLWDTFHTSADSSSTAFIASQDESQFNKPAASPTLPPLDQELVKIENVFGSGNHESEMVLIKRVGEGELSLTGWKLNDQNDHTFIFPDLVLIKGGAIQVYTRPGSDTAISLFWGLPESVWSTGETVTLLDSNNNIRSEYTIP